VDNRRTTGMSSPGVTPRWIVRSKGTLGIPNPDLYRVKVTFNSNGLEFNDTGSHLWRCTGLTKRSEGGNGGANSDPGTGFPAQRFSNTQEGSEAFAKFCTLLLFSTGYKSVDLLRSAWKRFVLIMQP
jgi:hypothetical protein